uniref:TRPM SLOG domain-containing protein n=1 Tax=Poecilia latipinna TaxID=48699 RepID=A0A3B3VAQ0_9TELE
MLDISAPTSVSLQNNRFIFFLCDSNGGLCQCGGVRELHDSVATGDNFGAAIVTQWDSQQHSSEYPTDAFGELDGLKLFCFFQFLRLSCDTPPHIIYTLITAHWGLPSPNLVVSVVGGEGHEKIKPWVRDILRKGLVRAAQSTGKKSSLCMDPAYV